MSQQLTDRQDTLHFPSLTDLQDLRQRLKNSGFLWSSLTSAERWRYHAYDYAFLRVRLRLDNRMYPLDPDGKWFHAGLVDEAERIYGEKPTPVSAPIYQSEIERDPEYAAHFRRQDDERLPLKRQVQVHGERLSNGTPTPEMLAFMECCRHQVEGNGKALASRGRLAFAREARMTQNEISRLHETLGVTAMESKPHENPEELRRGRVALGLEQEVREANAI